MVWRSYVLCGVLCGLAVIPAGCVPVPISASNPIPNLTTVAVVPFFNLSAERTVDGRRFAIAYFSELQKTPGFQVIPVGVTEQAILENHLSLDDPADALKLAEILRADAVVVGAITEYDPYYPPKLGMQVQWYSPRAWKFYPGIPSIPPVLGSQGDNVLVRGQSDDEFDDLPRPPKPGSTEELPAPRTQYPQPEPGLPVQSPRHNPGIGPVLVQPDSPRRLPQDLTPQVLPPQGLPPQNCPPGSEINLQLPGDPRAELAGDGSIKPLMTYTRFFDGADPRLVRTLKYYVGYRSDRRSGDWEAYLHRSDDFIQFASYLMVLEMLALHGGPVQTEYVLPCWK